MNFIKKKGWGIGLCIVLAAIATLLCKIRQAVFPLNYRSTGIWYSYGNDNHIDLPETGG